MENSGTTGPFRSEKVQKSLLPQGIVRFSVLTVIKSEQFCTRRYAQVTRLANFRSAEGLEGRVSDFCTAPAKRVRSGWMKRLSAGNTLADCYNPVMPRYAAIDIGSNSVRMLAAEVSHGTTTILAQDRQVTRLGESVFRSGRISDDALNFLTANLTRMAAIYNKLGIIGIRAVATAAVRDASNQREFLKRTRDALGTDIEIISGPEEARLIHLGVEARWPRPQEKTLIVDVGGGSAELIVSQNGHILDAISRPLGAVRLTEIFLKNDPATPENIHYLQSFISEKLQPFLQAHAGERFDRVIATSASAAALVCAVNQVPRAKRDEADRLYASLEDIKKLFSPLASSTLSQRKKIIGIGPRRAEIIVAGAAVFLHTLEAFDHPSLFYCAGGVRDGIIADLAAHGVGRERSQLSREQREVVEQMAAHYFVNMKHARQVTFLAGRLFEAFQSVHNLPPEAGKLLEAAALVHDTGHYISSTGHHKHSAYLVANSDLPGFTAKDRELISALCRFHRKSLPQPKHAPFDDLDARAKAFVIGLTPLLRMADSLDRSKEQKITNIRSVLRDGNLFLLLESAKDIDLETWSAIESTKVFREVYHQTLTVERTKASAV